MEFSYKLKLRVNGKLIRNARDVACCKTCFTGVCYGVEYNRNVLILCRSVASCCRGGCYGAHKRDVFGREVIGNLCCGGIVKRSILIIYCVILTLCESGLLKTEKEALAAIIKRGVLTVLTDAYYRNLVFFAVQPTKNIVIAAKITATVIFTFS